MTHARPTLLKELRTAIADAIAAESANEVPSICSRLGLKDGDRDEAFKGKFRYAERRLLDKLQIDLPVIASRLLEEVESYGLSEALAKLEEDGNATVSELTRRRIMAVFEGGPITTELDLLTFIQRVWPISRMPAYYEGMGRNTLEADFIQHTIRNDDWDSREILTACGLLTCSQRQLFRFLEEVSSPLAQSPERQSEIVASVNGQLQHDGFRLTVASRMSGSPVYQVQAVAIGSPADAVISKALEAFDPEMVHGRWEQALERRSTDPEGAITLARTLLEDVCKWVLVEAGVAYEEKDDLPTLYKRLAKILNLAPDAHTEQIFKQLLGNCQSIVESIGALRNKISDSHSPGPKRVRPKPRHAELTVNLAGAMATFLVSTWSARKDEAANGKP